jgi:trigger factor
MYVRGRLVLEEIAKREAIEVTAEEADAELERMAQAYRMEKSALENVITEGERKTLLQELKIQKALTLVSDSAVEQ